MSFGSKVLSMRRQSLHNRKHDGAFVESFLSNRGVTIDDLEMAFSLLSKDGHKITRNDIKDFTDKYFKGKLKMKQAKFISSWKEEINMDSLVTMLLKKPIADTKTAFADAFEWLDFSETGNLTKSDLKDLLKISSPYSLLHRDDFTTILNHYDFDKDGLLTLEDFKRMSLI